MATSHQQQSFQRKLIYIGLILAIFFGMVFYRPRVVEAEAINLSLREEDRGEVDLTGKAVKLGLTGMRGVAVTAPQRALDDPAHQARADDDRHHRAAPPGGGFGTEGRPLPRTTPGVIRRFFSSERYKKFRTF